MWSFWVFAAVEGRHARVGFGSCLMQHKNSGSRPSASDREGYRPYTVFNSILQQAPLDAFFIIGDVVYVDFPLHQFCGGCGVDYSSVKCRRGTASCMEKLAEKNALPDIEQPYKVLLAEQHFRNFIGRIHTMFTWDDHELFDNYDSGPENAYYKKARETWVSYIGYMNPPPWTQGELYFVHPVGDSPHIAECFVLDTRSYRNRERGTMLGTQQRHDVLRWLSTSAARWKLLISSSVIADAGRHPQIAKSDNWSVFPGERKMILDHIISSRVGGVIFLTGDVHFQAVIEHRSCLFEVVSSPLSSVSMAMNARKYNDEHVLHHSTSDSQFAILDINPQRIFVQLYQHHRPNRERASNETVVFEHSIHWRVCEDNAEL